MKLRMSIYSSASLRVANSSAFVAAYFHCFLKKKVVVTSGVIFNLHYHMIP